MCFKFVFDFDENYIFIINRTVYVFLLDSSLSLRVPRERSSLVKDQSTLVDKKIVSMGGHVMFSVHF